MALRLLRRSFLPSVYRCFISNISKVKKPPDKSGGLKYFYANAGNDFIFYRNAHQKP